MTIILIPFYSNRRLIGKKADLFENETLTRINSICSDNRKVQNTILTK